MASDGKGMFGRLFGSKNSTPTPSRVNEFNRRLKAIQRTTNKPAAAVGAAATTTIAAPRVILPPQMRYQYFYQVLTYLMNNYPIPKLNEDAIKNTKRNIAEMEKYFARFGNTPEQHDNIVLYLGTLKPILQDIELLYKAQREGRLAEAAAAYRVSHAPPPPPTVPGPAEASANMTSATNASILSALDFAIQSANHNASILNNKETRILLEKAMNLYEKEKNNRILLDKIGLLLSMRQASGTGPSNKPGGAAGASNVAQGGKRKTRRSSTRRRLTRRRRA